MCAGKDNKESGNEGIPSCEGVNPVRKGLYGPVVSRVSSECLPYNQEHLRNEGRPNEENKANFRCVAASDREIGCFGKINSLGALTAVKIRRVSDDGYSQGNPARVVIPVWGI